MRFGLVVERGGGSRRSSGRLDGQGGGDKGVVARVSKVYGAT